jgi:geranylgeranyl reductase family protein
MKYDVIVVGSGPAGSTTARECAEKGLSVLLLDKAEFPRDKPCGGAVTVRASKLLPFSIESVVERVITDVHLTHKQTNGFTRHSDDELASMTQRRNFDMLLLEKAVESGVVLKERATVRQVSRGASEVQVSTDDETYTASVLVAADGANGKTAEMSGIKQDFWQQVALEGNLTPNAGFPERWQTTFGLDVGGMPGGYGWIFPKGDHLNIGIGGWRYVGPELRANLTNLAKFYGYDANDMWGVRGHYLTIRKPESPLVDGNVVLVGDAAGLVDPMTDEGIYSAIWSGQAAARSIADYVGGETSDLLSYKRDLESELIPELNISLRFHDLFQLSPGLYMWAERRTSMVWTLARRILRGDQTYVNVMLGHKTTGTVIDFMSDLVRVTPFLQRRSGLRDPAPPERFFVRESVQS